jgi:O-antigen ligase
MTNFQRAILFLVGFTVPLQGVRVKVLVVAATANKLTALVLLVLAGFQFAMGRRRGGRDAKAAWVLGFAVAYLLSSTFSFLQGVSGAVLVAEAVSHLALVLFYFMIIFVLRSRDDLVTLMWGIALGGAFTALPAVLGLESGLYMGGLEGAARYEGLAAQTNLLGRDLGVCLAISAALFFAAGSQFRKLILLGAGALSAAGLVLSLSRAALVAAAGMWVLWMVRSGRAGSVRYAIPAVLMVLAVVVASPEGLQNRIDTLIDPQKRAEDGSVAARVGQFSWAGRAFASNPLLGVGVQNFVPWAQQQPGGKGIVNIVHNGYLEIAAGLGIVGIVPYAGLLILTWREYTLAMRMARRRRRSGDSQLRELGHYAVFLQIAYFGTLIVALAHPATKAKTMWLLYALSTVVLGLVRQRVAELELQPAAVVEADSHWLPGRLDAPGVSASARS